MVPKLSIKQHTKVDINANVSDTAYLDALSVFPGTSLELILFLCFVTDLQGPLTSSLFYIQHYRLRL
jgi:hypothetical protein